MPKLTAEQKEELRQLIAWDEAEAIARAEGPKDRNGKPIAVGDTVAMKRVRYVVTSINYYGGWRWNAAGAIGHTCSNVIRRDFES